MLAAQRGHEDIVALLLRHYTEVDRKYRRRDKALYLAACNRHEEVMEILSKHPADGSVRHRSLRRDAEAE